MSRRRWIAAGLIAAAAIVLIIAGPGRSRTIFEGDSPFGAVRVVERWDGVRSLHTGAGRAMQSAVLPGRPLDLQLEYTRTATIGVALAPDSARILFVGLGGGAMPMHTRHVRPDVLIDVVEIDPLIVEVAHDWFGFRSDARLRTHVADGRAFIEAAPVASWDLIVLDAFSDDGIPLALTTREFLETVRSRLRRGGIVVGNLWTAAPLHESMLATYLDVFADVHLVQVDRRRQEIVIASDGAERLNREVLVLHARALDARADLRFDLAGIVARGYRRPVVTRAPVLRDEVPAGAGG